MDFEDFRKELVEKALKIRIELSEHQIEQFYIYMKLLTEWNEKINLTAIIEPKEIILKHFIDSLTISSQIQQSRTIADIGSGAGFPGIPLKIVNPEKELVLIDSLSKRVNFLNEVIKKCNINGITVIHARAEEIGHNSKYRGQFDVTTSRAVAKLNVLLEYMMPLVKLGGKCICLKGPNIDDEIKESKKALDVLGGEISKIEKINLPDSDNKRTIIEVLSVKQLPNKYPRKPGTPTSSPL